MDDLPRRRPVVRRTARRSLCTAPLAACRGGWPGRCYDANSCTLRRKMMPILTSSKFPNGDSRWPPTMHLPGIFDVDPRRNPFAGANLVQIAYCSSDAWVGDIAAADATALATTENMAGPGHLGWAFRGQAIVEATLAVLAADYGLGSQPDTKLLFGGGHFPGRSVRSSAPSHTVRSLRRLLRRGAWRDVQPGLRAGSCP